MCEGIMYVRCYGDGHITGGIGGYKVEEGCA